MCLYGENIRCLHSECLRGRFPFPNIISYDSNLIHKLYDLVNIQNHNLQNIAEQNKLLLSSIDNLSSGVSKVYQQGDPISPLDYPMNTTLSEILKDDTNTYSIVLLESFPSNILKEKGFKISIGLIDANNKKVQIPHDFKFKVELYTTDTPSKLLEFNIHGKKILRGTVTAFTDDNWSVNFNNIVINEVSSHYRNDCLKMVIQIIGSHIVKPLVINNFSVRARKAR